MVFSKHLLLLTLYSFLSLSAQNELPDFSQERMKNGNVPCDHDDDEEKDTTNFQPSQGTFEIKEAYKALDADNFEELRLIFRSSQKTKELFKESVKQGKPKNTQKVLFIKDIKKDAKNDCQEALSSCQEKAKNKTLLLGAVLGGAGACVACVGVVAILIITKVLKH